MPGSGNQHGPNQRLWAGVALAVVLATGVMGLTLANRPTGAFVLTVVALLGPIVQNLVTAEKVNKLQTDLRDGLGLDIAQKAADAMEETKDPPRGP